jgi:ADP-heptose:LPS heptosyltransferase
MVSSSADPVRARRLLFIRPRFIGDVCLTLPALDAARAACPGARVAYVVEASCAPLLEGDPRIDELMVVPAGAGGRDTVRLIRRLRRFAPEVAFDFFCNPRTAQWTFLSGAPFRVGYARKGLRSWAYTHHVEPRTFSSIEFHLASVAALGWPAAVGVPRLHVGAPAREEANDWLAASGVSPSSVLVGFHPGARWETRRWFPDRYRDLARRFLDARPDGIALISGAESEEPLVRSVLEGLPRERAIPAVGLPLARFVAVQSRCAAFVCGDTGPVHTAVAAGAPTLGLMSRNRPAMFFPYPESVGARAYYARAECSPCDRDLCPDLRCLKRLTVEGAWRILDDLLASGAPARGEASGVV